MATSPPPQGAYPIVLLEVIKDGECPNAQASFARRRFLLRSLNPVLTSRLYTPQLAIGFGPYPEHWLLLRC